jgi:hypothetical protein
MTTPQEILDLTPEAIRFYDEMAPKANAYVNDFVLPGVPESGQANRFLQFPHGPQDAASMGVKRIREVLGVREYYDTSELDFRDGIVQPVGMTYRYSGYEAGGNGFWITFTGIALDLSEWHALVGQHHTDGVVYADWAESMDIPLPPAAGPPLLTAKSRPSFQVAALTPAQTATNTVLGVLMRSRV